MKTSADELRVGTGYDIHRLQAGGQLVIGGVVVAEGISAAAHSDGDVAIHALIDALLGALGRGDIGEHFPNTSPEYRNIASGALLEATMQQVRGEGWRVVNADIAVLAERPRLKPFKPRMASVLRDLLGAPVNIKAGTNEGCDAVGRGEAVAAHAVVLLARAE